MDTWIVQAKKIMRDKGVTQKDIASAMGKSTRGAVGHYFTGRSQPTLNQLKSLAKYLDITLAELVDPEGVNNNPFNIDTLESFSPIEFNTLKSISPIDGRYSKKTSDLSSIFSEFGLIKYRVLVEVKWLQALSRNSEIVDPKNFKQNNFVSKNGETCIIPPNSFVLSSTIEYFKIPNDIMVICLGKSTYARCGIIVNVTPLEPGWEGYVTLEFSNTTPLPAKIYANEGAAQFIFLKGNEKPEVTYADRDGKYMKQKGVTLPKV